jgi:hypothetical protein
MKSIIKKIDDLLVAITFAEAGEYDTASNILGQKLDMQDKEEALEPGLETI